MKTIIYRHHWNDKNYDDHLTETVINVTSETKFSPKPKSSATLKAEVLRGLQQRGWSGEVVIDPASNISITSVKGTTGLCFQTGNIARMYADLLKLQTIYAKNVISKGIFVIPTKSCANILGSNIANFERLSRELAIFEQVITMPLLIIGIE